MRYNPVEMIDESSVHLYVESHLEATGEVIQHELAWPLLQQQFETIGDLYDALVGSVLHVVLLTSGQENGHAHSLLELQVVKRTTPDRANSIAAIGATEPLNLSPKDRNAEYSIGELQDFHLFIEGVVRVAAKYGASHLVLKVLAESESTPLAA